MAPTSHNLKWTPPVLRSLVEYVDRHKGIDGPFMTNLDVTLDGAVEFLKQRHYSDDEKAFSRSSVASAISRLGMNYSTEARFRTVTAVYQFGRDVLDLSQFPRGTFTQQEIIANQAIDTSSFQLVARQSANTSNSIFTPKMIRVLLDVVEENKGADSIFLKDRTQACKIALSALQQRVPAECLLVVNLEQIDRKVGGFAKKFIVSRNNAVENKTHQVFIYGFDVLDLPTFGAGIFTQDEIKAWARSRGRHSASPPRRKRQRTMERFSEVPDTDDEVLVSSTSPTTLNTFSGILSAPFHSLTAPRLGNRSMDNTYIATTMSEVLTSLSDAVIRRLQAAGIDSNQPFVINMEQIGADVSELLENLLFCDRSELVSAIRALDSMRASRHLPNHVFISSMVGIAVTTWSLRPKPQGTNPNFHANIILRELHRRDPQLAAEVEAESLNALLDEHVMPYIKQRSSDCAERLNSALLRYMTPPHTDRSSHQQSGFEVGQTLPAYWSEFQESIPQQSQGPQNEGRLSVTAGRRSVHSTKQETSGYGDFVAEWKRNLAAIFEKAFKLRIKMEKKGGTYSFDFPTPGLRYTVSDKKGDPIHQVRKENMVMLGLLPSVHVRTKGGNGQLGERVVCAPLHAYSYND